MSAYWSSKSSLTSVKGTAASTGFVALLAARGFAVESVEAVSLVIGILLFGWVLIGAIALLFLRGDRPFDFSLVSVVDRASAHVFQ
jgi:hypothetical protein